MVTNSCPPLHPLPLLGVAKSDRQAMVSDGALEAARTLARAEAWQLEPQQHLQLLRFLVDEALDTEVRMVVQAAGQGAGQGGDLF